MSVKKDLCKVVLVGLLAMGFSGSALATSYVGTVNWIEIWPNGNVAFKLDNVTAPCNSQFILNGSMPGVKNLYAFLLTAKATGTSVTVAQTVCAPADNYGGSYALVDYLYYY